MNELEGCTCKFGRILSKYSQLSFERDLGQQWRASGGPGLRTLADNFNKRILRASLETEGEAPIDGEVENLYRLLTDEDVSSGTYTQAKNRLRERGVDPDTIEEDFLSYQTVNRHFKNCSDFEKEKQNAGPGEQKLKDRIFSLQNRTVRVTENTLEQQNGLQLKEQNVFIDITVSCEECGVAVPVAEAIDGVSCDCFQ